MGSEIEGFDVGEVVCVRDKDVRRHMRTPRYSRNCIGIIEEYVGAFLNPEKLAEGQCDGPVINLYRVRLSMEEIWGADVEQSGDVVLLEVYEHWLSRPGAPASRKEDQ
ncbi:nitrile hydratase subunit beta [Aquisalimonas sp. 2447]|uniref:SH3-like domain-containing protein n=1 Tax=Aquisalimonas sp. 2447 TaxID=2740807 RepID=UPI00143259EF|nr:nitrile hydratase subunit beta [Aquisalimonas sp. 2447]